MEILGVLDVPVWALLTLMLCMLFYLYATWTHSTWSSLGVPGPRPLPLLGNSLEMMRRATHYVFADWQKKYGSVYGMYQGVRPSLVVSDLDLLREIMVKNFSNFVDRNFVRGTRPKVIDKGLFFAGGTTWKRIRNLMTPSFSTSKLKLTCHYINRCSQILADNIGQKTRSQEPIDVKDVFGSFTLDVIAGTAFGLETNSQTQQAEPFVYHMKNMFRRLTGNTNRSTILLANAFPFLAPVFGKLGFQVFNSEHSKFFVKSLDDIIEARKKDGRRDKRAADLLQMLVDAEADPDVITDLAQNSDETKNHKRMTKEEMLGQGFIVLIAGFETTATTLQYLTYNLTMNSEAQQRVYEEIRDNLGDADPTYENVSSLPFLDAAVHETLRMFPPVPFVNREAAETFSCRGVTVPAGCGVVINIHQILHDPQYFPEPHTFLPDRFLPENRAKLPPLTVDLAFGYGPRQCIGMRLALLEVKFAAVRIFRHFRFLKCDETPETITLKGQGLTKPERPIKVKAEVRAQ